MVPREPATTPLHPPPVRTPAFSRRSSTAGGRARSGSLRDTLGQSDGGLGRHLGVLQEHGYIETEKVFENRRPRTWIRMTGAEAFREEQELLATASPEAGGKGDAHTAAMTIVFAGEDTEADDDREPGAACSPAPGTGHPATAVAWFSAGPCLASVVVVAGEDVAVPALETLMPEAHRSLATHQN
jgi:hypothetical protein